MREFDGRCVYCSVNYPCALRSAESAKETENTLHYASLYGMYKGDDFKDRNIIFKDVVLLNSFVFSDPNSPLPLSIPLDGFVISTTFAAVGGPEAVLKMCSECPANFSGETVGCQINVRVWEELGARFSSVAAELGFEDIYQREFHQESGDPWRGIWIRQPMSRAGLELLVKVLDYLLSEDTEDESRPRRRTFLKALTFALDRSLEVEIAHGSPYNTILGAPSHCRWCKATVGTYGMG